MQERHVSLNDLRAEIEGQMTSGHVKEAARLLVDLWDLDQSQASANYVRARFAELSDHLSPRACRVAIIRSFTVEPAVPLLQAGAATYGVDLNVHVGDFNCYVQEMLDENSSLYACCPDVVILAARTQDLVPELWSGFSGLAEDQVEGAIEGTIRNVDKWLEAFRSRSKAALVLHSLELPSQPAQGILDAQLQVGQGEAIRKINKGLVTLAREHVGVYVLDYDALMARHGRLHWHDERKWLTMRMPVSAECLIHLANEWLRFVLPPAGKSCKAVVVDLDNTLWGGVIGEDGMDGISLSAEYPGAAYQAVQRALLDLYHRGILLAVCSKNNHDDAMEAISNHPGMLLCPEHFAVFRINWMDKARNLRDIAAELNIGTDALAFLDDNPVERQWVRSQLPEVTVIRLPDDPLGYARALRESPVLERLSLSDEDRRRSQYYAEQRQRKEVKDSASNLEEFYHSLEMEAEIGPVTPKTLARVAQLTQKTNQFNLTTRRYTEQDISEFVSSPETNVHCIRVKDRFGDNGLVGVAITKTSGDDCEVDTFLLSCRVIGRGVETALLATVVAKARQRGLSRVVGWFLPSHKNAPAKDFYRTHGFACTLEEGTKSRWEYDLGSGTIVCPAWIALDISEKGGST